jgi:putative MATE family efflux protein
MDNIKESRLSEFIADPKKAIWKLSLPMMFGMMVQAVYMLVDTAFIGKWVGGSALAALGYVFPVFFIIFGLTFGLGSGVTTVIAQYIGQQDKRRADNAAEHTLLLGFVISIIVVIIGLFMGETFLSMQGADEIVVQEGMKYFKIMIGGSMFMIISIFFRSILSGEGEAMFPMKVMGIGTVMNIILDPIFIHFYGLSGAAIATIISQAIVAIIFFYMMFFKQHTYIRFDLKNFSFNPMIIKRIFKLGVPSSLSMIIMSIGVTAFNWILNSTVGVAAYQTAGRLEHLFFLPLISIATSMVTLVGMFFGAQRMDLVKQVIKYGLSRALAVTMLISISFFLFADSIMPLFTDSTEIADLAVSYFKVLIFAYPFITIGLSSGRIMQGLGHATPMLVVTLLRVLLISAPLAWYFRNVLDLPIIYVWIAILISSVIASSTSFIWMMTVLKKLQK